MDNEKKKKKANAEAAPDFPPPGNAAVPETAKPPEAEKPAKNRRAKAKARAAAEYVSPSAPLGEMEPKVDAKKNSQPQTP